MVRLILTIVIGLFTFIATIFAQDVTGDWYGQLNVQGTKLRINFHVVENNGIYTTTMDSPDQGAMAIPTDKTTFNNNVLSVTMNTLRASYKGTLKDNKIDGTFSQVGNKTPLVLTRNKIEKTKLKSKPQEPKKPYNYVVEELTFSNKNANNIKLAGTLTLPKNINKPAVAILISGSGPQDRNESSLGHKPFLVLANYLTNNGIAVLRFDDRGVGESEGTQKNATSVDFATDVAAAVTYLKTRKDIDVNKIGLIGHSEGGFIAPMVIAKDKSIAFFVSLAGTGVDGATVLLTQAKRSMELAGAEKDFINASEKLSNTVYNLIKKEKKKEKLAKKLENYLKTARKDKDVPKKLRNILTDQRIKQQVEILTSPWMRYFIVTNPNKFLCQVKCPVLALNGEKDFQVLPELNLSGLKKALKKSKYVTTIELKDLNHLFQTCETGALSEYAQIEETFAPKALKLIADWINKRF